MTVLEIFIFRGEQLIGSRVFSDSAVTVGRGSASMLVLDDRQVSRVHASIELAPGPGGMRMRVRDLESQIGTRLNGQNISESFFVESDALEIGPFRLKVTRRSMGQRGDFDEEEPTDAGHIKKAHAPRSKASERATVAPRPARSAASDDALDRPVLRVAPPMLAAPQREETPAVKPADKPADTAGDGIDLLPPLPHPLPQTLKVDAPKAPRLPDSPPEEISAGLDDTSLLGIPAITPEQLQKGPAAAKAQRMSTPVQAIDPLAETLRPAQALVADAVADAAAGRVAEPAAPAVSAPQRPAMAMPVLVVASKSDRGDDQGDDPTVQWRGREQRGPKTSGATSAAPVASAAPAQPPPVDTATPAQPPQPVGAPALKPPIAFVAPVPASTATPQPAHHDRDDEHEDDDHDDDDDFVPTFSLLEMLDQEPPRPPGKSHLLLEIIQHRDGQVHDVVQLGAQQSLPIDGLRLLRHEPEGRAQLTVNDRVGGQVFLADRVVPLDEVRRGARDRQGVGLLELREGDRAEVELQRGPAGARPVTLHVRFVRQPALAHTRPTFGALLRPLLNLYVVAAVLFHASLLFGLSRLPPSETAADPEEARFAEISLKQLQPEPPPPEVKPPEPEPPSPTKDPTPREAPKVRAAVRTRPRAAARPAASPDNALAALDLIKPAETKGPALKDVVTNINAVSVPADARSRFRVGGAIGKLPVGEVRLSTAGVARDATTSGRELLKGENVGAMKGGGSGDVRGVVKAQSPAALQAAGSGRLSRAQILKVISEHVAQIQACYERVLARDRSLAGKITFDWVISPTGSVESVRVRSSTMSGTAVSSCILQEIRGWTFPTPEGGSVSVTYPFIFSAQGF